MTVQESDWEVTGQFRFGPEATIMTMFQKQQQHGDIRASQHRLHHL